MPKEEIFLMKDSLKMIILPLIKLCLLKWEKVQLFIPQKGTFILNYFPKSNSFFTSNKSTYYFFKKRSPKTVENFSVHSRNGYYNGCLFHRVIRGFMIQTGDPEGDGTGGTSIWGREFEDEFHRTLRHDRPFVVSMANAGPNTNGSQFFITTVPCPSLDNKHTVFGRVTKGTEVVQAIEKVRTDKDDKPYEDIKIISIKINFES